MSRTHAGGVTRVVIRTDAARRPDAHPLARPTPVREWEGSNHRRGLSTKTYRATMRRIARRRARKGYRYAEGERL